jgi:hypothetical protein
MSYIRELKEELAALIDRLSRVNGMTKTHEWYVWRDRLIRFVVTKVYESYRNGREGITDTSSSTALTDFLEKHDMPQ